MSLPGISSQHTTASKGASSKPATGAAKDPFADLAFFFAPTSEAAKSNPPPSFATRTVSPAAPVKSKAPASDSHQKDEALLEDLIKGMSPEERRRNFGIKEKEKEPAKPLPPRAPTMTPPPSFVDDGFLIDGMSDEEYRLNFGKDRHEHKAKKGPSSPPRATVTTSRPRLEVAPPLSMMASRPVAMAPRVEVPKDEPLAPIIRGRINQHSLKGPTGKSLGTSACVSHALYSTIALNRAFQEKRKVDGEFLEGILIEGCKRHNAALQSGGLKDGYNLMVDEAMQHGRWPEVHGMDYDSVVVSRGREIETFTRMLDTLCTKIERASKTSGSAILIKYGSASSITARKLPSGKWQFHYFDSHGEQTAGHNEVFLQSFSDKREFAAFLNQRFPYIDIGSDEQGADTAFGFQDNPNALEITYPQFN